MLVYDLGAPEFDILYWLYEQYKKIKKGSVDAFKFVLGLILLIVLLIFSLIIFPVYLNIYGIHKMTGELDNITREDFLKDEKKQRLIKLLASPFVDSYFRFFLFRRFYIKYTAAVYRLKNLIDKPEFDTHSNYDAMLKDWD